LISKKIFSEITWPNESKLNWDEMSNFYRGPSRDASYKISVHLASGFRGDLLEINQAETRIACGGHVC
jgi:hypothetical protein